MTRTRFAPSPTGFLHIGGLRTAAYAYALAKHDNGEFLLRIEDTDQKREVAGAREKIHEILKICGLNWDAETVQSVRAREGLYAQAANKLLVSGYAFYCQCEGRNAKTDGYSNQLRDPCRDKHFTSGAIKLKIPDNQTVSYHDFVLDKDISWETNTLSDTVLLKSDGIFPTYHLAVAIDDFDSQISHVIRTQEWLTSTPLHILIHQYLDIPMPQYGHPTAILDPDGGKLSKRKGNVSCEEFFAQGYLPEAVLNFVILLGWAPKNNQELFTLREFVTGFDMKGFQKSNPVMNLEKLDWFNGQYIRQLDDAQLADRIKPYSNQPLSQEELIKRVALVKDRLVTLKDFDNLTIFLSHRPNIDPTLFASAQSSLGHLKFAKENLNQLGDTLVPMIKEKGWKVGDFFMTLRIAICGAKFTPPLDQVIKILGPDEVAQRFEISAKLIGSQT